MTPEEIVDCIARMRDPRGFGRPVRLGRDAGPTYSRMPSCGGVPAAVREARLYPHESPCSLAPCSSFKTRSRMSFDRS